MTNVRVLSVLFFFQMHFQNPEPSPNALVAPSRSQGKLIYILFFFFSFLIFFATFFLPTHMQTPTQVVRRGGSELS